MINSKAYEATVQIVAASLSGKGIDLSDVFEARLYDYAKTVYKVMSLLETNPGAESFHTKDEF